MVSAHFILSVNEPCAHLVKRFKDQGGHSPGKPGKVREFQSGQGKWKKSGKSQGNCNLPFGL